MHKEADHWRVPKTTTGRNVFSSWLDKTTKKPPLPLPTRHDLIERPTPGDTFHDKADPLFSPVPLLPVSNWAETLTETRFLPSPTPSMNPFELAPTWKNTTRIAVKSTLEELLTPSARPAATKLDAPEPTTATQTTTIVDEPYAAAEPLPIEPVAATITNVDPLPEPQTMMDTNPLPEPQTNTDPLPTEPPVDAIPDIAGNTLPRLTARQQVYEDLVRRSFGTGVQWVLGETTFPALPAPQVIALELELPTETTSAPTPSTTPQEPPLETPLETPQEEVLTEKPISNQEAITESPESEIAPTTEPLQEPVASMQASEEIPEPEAEQASIPQAESNPDETTVPETDTKTLESAAAMEPQQRSTPPIPWLTPPLPPQIAPHDEPETMLEPLVICEDETTHEPAPAPSPRLTTEIQTPPIHTMEPPDLTVIQTTPPPMIQSVIEPPVFYPVPVENLLSGMANAMTDVVEAVVNSAWSVAVPDPAPLHESNVMAAQMRGLLRASTWNVVSGVGAILSGTLTMVTGIAGCLTQSVTCAGQPWSHHKTPVIQHGTHTSPIRQFATH